MASRAAPTDPLSRARERVRVRARQLRRSATEAERALWQRLRDRQLAGYKFRRQHPIGGYFADFACVEAKLVIELDGGQHFEPAAMAVDARRTAELSAHGFHVLRFNDREVLAERDAVVTGILNWLAVNHPHPNPLPQAVEGVNAAELSHHG